MRTSVSRYFKDNLVGFLALFVALGGTGAYAANTIGSADIVDGQVKSADVANQDLTGGDIKDNSISSFDVGSLVGDDVVDNTLTGEDIKNQTLDGQDIHAESLTGFNILDGFLSGRDIAQTVAYDFPTDIGTVNASSCVNKIVSGLGAQADNLLLTPSVGDANGALMYDAKYDVSSNNVTIHVCNWSNANINDATTHFNLLVIAGQ